MLDPNNKPLAPLVPPEPRALVMCNGMPLLPETGPALPPGLSAGPTVSTLAQALRRRWLLASTLPLAGALVFIVAVFVLWPARYTATARLQVASRTDPGIFHAEHEED